jgi:hypothetical protein
MEVVLEAQHALVSATEALDRLTSYLDSCSSLDPSRAPVPRLQLLRYGTLPDLQPAFAWAPEGPSVVSFATDELRCAFFSASAASAVTDLDTDTPAEAIERSRQSALRACDAAYSLLRRSALPPVPSGGVGRTEEVDVVLNPVEFALNPVQP